ncbi:MAG TPA: hypothetical protein VNT76_01130, partial [Candidatus Binatus sp.]|nr:hypothetical protein [Candidatus Binatus sp.]
MRKTDWQEFSFKTTRHCTTCPVARRIGLYLILLFLAIIFFTGVPLAQAQQPGKSFRVGYLAVRSGTGPLDAALKTALRELGYIEGQNILYLHRWADGNFNRLGALAEELAQ